MTGVVGYSEANESSFQRTFRHFGSKDVWSWQLVLFSFYILSVVSFLTDSVRLSSFTTDWLLVSGAGFLPPLAIGLCYKRLYLDRVKDRSRPVLNLLMAGFIGSSRNLSVGIFAYISGLDTAALWTFRFFGGFAGGVVIFIFWAITQGTRTDYLFALRRLSFLQNELAASREGMPDLLTDVYEGLQTRARNAIIPQLDVMQELLKKNRIGTEAASHLRKTLANVVRPLMDELREKTPTPFLKKNILNLDKVQAQFPDRYVLFTSLRTWTSSITQVIGYGAWLIFLEGFNGLFTSLISAAIYSATFGACKLAVPRGKIFSSKFATTATIAIGLISTGTVSIYVGSQINHIPTYIAIVSVLAITGIFAPLFLSHAWVRQQGRLAAEEKISKELFSIAKENSLFSQSVWVFRKRWLLLLHGTIQSSITAAVTRLETAKEVDEYLVQLVKQDLSRAEKAIEAEATFTLDFRQMTTELQQTWQGICNVKSEISERAKRALQKNHETAFCVNELVKEAVSNAVRHGLASEATIAIDRIDDDVLHLEISNNGVPPKQKDKPGIGSQMLDEICLNWQLTTSTKKVVLIADLPFKF